MSNSANLNAGEVSHSTFYWPQRVYIEDTDAGGIVFYANYLRYFERARSEWLRSIGLDQRRLMATGVRFVVRDLSIRYRLPALLDDELVTTLTLTKRSKAGMTMKQTVLRMNQASAIASDSSEFNEIDRLPKSEIEQQILVDADISIACINNQGRPVAIPDDLNPLFNVQS
ncbi:MAG: YbgC/FadM family acyl-CoA thioesterase [Oleibacter sp.]|nr:YbgC/FadM family acyl-CoA thioesterase [Thalassolituus sp.]